MIWVKEPGDMGLWNVGQGWDQINWLMLLYCVLTLLHLLSLMKNEEIKLYHRIVFQNHKMQKMLCLPKDGL